MENTTLPLILHICFIYEGHFVFLYSFCVDEKLLLSSDRKDIINFFEIYPYLDYRRFLPSQFYSRQMTLVTLFSFKVDLMAKNIKMKQKLNLKDETDLQNNFQNTSQQYDLKSVSPLSYRD